MNTYDTSAPGSSEQPGASPLLIQCEITQLDGDGHWRDVTRPGVAQAAVDALLGTGRHVEPTLGGWLVQFTEEEAARLRIWGSLVLEQGPFQLEAEMP
jgi:hypothetical protein